jgi:hypothetical protein
MIGSLLVRCPRLRRNFEICVPRSWRCSGGGTADLPVGQISLHPGVLVPTRCRISVARRVRFAQAFQDDLGRPAPSRENISLSLCSNRWLFPRCLVPTRGADRASSRTRDGMWWTRERRRDRGRRASQARERSRGVQDERRIARTAKPCGPDTRCWCQACRGFPSPTGFGQILICKRR